MTLLRMQLEEKRRHIEAEKRRSLEQWEEHRRHVGHTAFWYMMGKARGAGDQLGQGPGEQLGQGPGEQLVQGPGKHPAQGNGNEVRKIFVWPLQTSVLPSIRVGLTSCFFTSGSSGVFP